MEGVFENKAGAALSLMCEPHPQPTALHLVLSTPGQQSEKYLKSFEFVRIKHRHKQVLSNHKCEQYKLHISSSQPRL